MTVLAVLIGGGVGAVCRYSVEGLIAPRQRGPFPLSTLIVNVTGSTALGALVAVLLAGRAELADPWVVTGFFGGFTTFSTFTYENMRLIEDGAWTHVLWNLALSGPLSFMGSAAAYLLTSKLVT